MILPLVKLFGIYVILIQNKALQMNSNLFFLNCKSASRFAGFMLIFVLLPVYLTIAEEGSHPAEFLSLGVGARALGMGGMFVSIANDATAAYWNPAGLTEAGNHAFSTMYSDSFRSSQGGFLNKGLVQYSFINYVLQIEDIGSVGVSWIRLGVDEIPRTTFIDVNGDGELGSFQDKNANGEKDPGEFYIDRPTVAEYFNNADNAILFSYAKIINANLSVGGNLKILRQTIFQNSGNGFGTDLGMIFQPINNLRLGLMIQDATGTQIVWDTGSNPTFTRKTRLRIGGSYGFSISKIGHLTCGIDAESRQADLKSDQSNDILVYYGSELWLFKLVALRIGGRGGKISSGAGFRLKFQEAQVFADYAFKSHDLGSSQRISVSGSF